MKISVLRAVMFSVPGRFKIATSDTRFSHHFVVGLEVEGIQGWGSGVLYGARPLETARLFREKGQPFLEHTEFSDLPAARQALQDRFTQRDPSLVFALDSALWDIEGKLNGQPVYRLLGIQQRSKIPVTEQVFIQEEGQERREIEQILENGTQRIKIKTGLDPHWDVERLRRIREQVGPAAELQVDANGGYDYDQAVWTGKQLRNLGIGLIEDPLPVRDWARIRSLREATGLQVMQDAGVRTLDDLDRLIQLEAADLLNLKLTRIGGLTAALQLAEIGRQANIQPAVGCSEDLGMGMASILHLAAIFPEPAATEGVGSYRLGFDIVTEPFLIEAGCLLVPTAPGLGVSFNDEKLQAAAKARGFKVGEAISPLTPEFTRSIRFNQWYQRWFTLGFRIERKIKQAKARKLE